MRAQVTRCFRALTWFCVILLAVLSLLPAQYMVRTGGSGRFEHFVAYAGSAAIAVVGYRRLAPVLAGFCAYAGVLEYLQSFSPGRDVAIDDVVVSALGALCGGIVAGLAWRSLHDVPPR